MYVEDKEDKVFIPQTKHTVTASDYNQIKNEIQGAIELAGMEPEKDVIQFPTAIKQLTEQSGAAEMEKITAEGTKQVGLVTAAGTAQKTALETAGAEQVAAVEAAGTAQVSKVQNEGSEQVSAAKNWASKTDSPVEGDLYSAKKYAQDAAQSAASILDKTYTSDNLVPGKGISFDEVLPEGGIDDHTKGCWHFDGNAENAGGDMVIAASAVAQYYDDGKFGKAARMTANGTTGWVPASTSADYSYDFWIKVTATINARVGGWGSVTTGNGRFYIMSNKKVASFLPGSDNSASNNPSADIPINTWTHLAYCKKDGIGHWFINGKLIDKRADSGASATSFAITPEQPSYFRVDEFRISDIARWTEDFEPPTQPYAVAESTGKKAVNNTITKLSQLENDSEYVTQAQLAASDPVVESAVLEDGSWYRKYKSGWLEQGGPANTNATVTFPKPFATAPASLLVASTNTASAYCVKPANISATSFVCWQYQGYYLPTYWYACGQGAEEE